MTSEQNQGQQAAPTSPPPGSGGGRSRLGLYIGGGCAVAAILGFLAILVVGALIFFISSSPATTDPGPQQPTTEPSQPEPEPQPEPAPEEGSLDELIQQEVSNFTLQQIEGMPEVIDAGASDARQMVYASADGVELFHYLSAWTSPDVANEVLQGAQDYWVSEEGFQVADEFPITVDDQEVGDAVILTGEIEGSEVEVALWTNDVLVGEIVAPAGYGADFFNNLPY